MQKQTGLVLAGLALSLASAIPLQAAQIDGDERARSGTVRCGGSHHLRQNGAELHFTSYNFRNFNADTPITIERLTFFDATGAVLFDSNVSGFPTFDNSVLGPSDNVLDPNQTAQLDTTDVLRDNFLLQERRPIQVEIVWSAPARVLTLGASATRLVRERNPANGNQGAERSRDANACRTIRIGN